MPGPWSPTAFSSPEGVSAILGVGRPARGAMVIDRVVKAPSRMTSKNCASSRPVPPQPEAVRTGLGSSTWAM
ncbi:hypothetical protein Pth03_22690 [Planotetraspora thailandica]|uniref:Uncharacterized protein n=1 Tax=Planotetraspora thailandica TaxID=487172 RepID=A0A8J3VBG3_9ACTN|nr:hypothetical protein Pth03_22690 [Planotetraspora thailandica]